MIKQTAITMIGAAALATSAQAEVEYDVTVGAHSHYVWRGVDQGGGQLIDTSLTASKELQNGGVLSANLWYATTGNAGLDELDATLDYSVGTEFADFSFGAIGYFLPDTGFDTYELYVGLSKDLGSGVTGSIIYYRDIDEADNNGYAELGLSKGFEFGYLNPTLDVVAAYQFNVDRWSHYQATLSTSHEISSNATISPYLTYVLADLAPRDEFVGGVSISVGF